MDSTFWDIVLYSAILGIIIAIVAHFKGRKPLFWFFYGFVIWPIALAHILVIPKTQEAAQREAHSAGRIPCPHCAEMILRQAQICPHCQRELEADWWLAKIPEILKYRKPSQGTSSDGLEVYSFAGKEYPHREAAELARDQYLADRRARRKYG